MATTVSDIILQAYTELGVIQDTSETISTTLRDNAFLVLQQGYSRASADRLLAYLVVHQTFSLVAGTSKYTLGTAGTLATAARPVAVTSWDSTSGSFSSGGEPTSFEALRKLKQNTTGKVSVLAEAVAADQGFPSINVEVYPTPATSPGSLTLDYWTPLVQFSAVSDTLTLPDGFERWLVTMLATDLEPRFPLDAGPRAELARNHANNVATIKQRVAAIISTPPGASPAGTGA